MDVDRYYVVGQDWGASVVYSMMNLYPENVIKAVTVAIPHSSCIKLTPRLVYKARHFIKFRNEKKSALSTRKDNFHYLDVLYKRWSPGWTTYRETGDLIKQTFALEGRLEAALGYYWSLNRNSGDKELAAFNQKVPQMPLMAIAGKQDGALVMRPFRKMEKAMNPDFELVIRDDAGHFLHREVPDFFVARVAEFFAK
jgi:pimeloyl-ACP methyl ester carboxylesterase